MSSENSDDITIQSESLSVLSKNSYEKSFIDSDSSYKILNNEEEEESSNNEFNNSTEIISSFDILLTQILNKNKKKITIEIKKLLLEEIKENIKEELGNEFKVIIQKILKDIELIKQNLN